MSEQQLERVHVDFDEWAESGEAPSELHRQLVDQIENECRELGLYLENVRIGAHPSELDPAHPTKLMVWANFTIGDVAWRDRTLQPAVEADNREFRNLADAAEDGLGDDMAARWKQRFDDEGREA